MTVETSLTNSLDGEQVCAIVKRDVLPRQVRQGARPPKIAPSTATGKRRVYIGKPNGGFGYAGRQHALDAHLRVSYCDHDDFSTPGFRTELAKDRKPLEDS